MDDRMYQMIHTVLQKGELNSILAGNERTKKFGLTLTQEEAKMLVQCRKETLAAQRRVEFGEGILKEPLFIASGNFSRRKRKAQSLNFMTENAAPQEHMKPVTQRYWIRYTGQRDCMKR